MKILNTRKNFCSNEDVTELTEMIILQYKHDGIITLYTWNYMLCQLYLN